MTDTEVDTFTEIVTLTQDQQARQCEHPWHPIGFDQGLIRHEDGGEQFITMRYPCGCLPQVEALGVKVACGIWVASVLAKGRADCPICRGSFPIGECLKVLGPANN